jgi:WD40 repeat protein
MRTLKPSAPFRVTSERGVAGPSRVVGTAFVPGGHLLLAGSDYGSVYLIDADRRRVVKRLRGYPAESEYAGQMYSNTIWTPAVSRDGRRFVTVPYDPDGPLILWSLPDGRPLWKLRINASEVRLSPNGRLVSVQAVRSDSVQDRVEIWDVDRHRRVATLRPAAGAYLARWSPDGKLLAVGDLRRRIILYSTQTWKPVRTLTGGSAGWATFSPDSRTLVTGNADGTMGLWDVASGQALGAPLPGPPDNFTVPMFTPGGTHLVAGYQDGTASIWDLRPATLERQACAVAGRTLTRAEWADALPGRDYEPACTG